MTNRRWALLGMIALAILLAAIQLEWTREPELVLADGKGAPLAVFPLSDGRFEHVFIHSVHRTPVEEKFRIEPQDGAPRLHLYELRYQSQGVGMPSDAEGGYRLDGGTFILAMDRSFEQLPIMVSPVEGHGITIAGVLTPFVMYQSPGRPIILSARLTRHIRLRRSHPHE